MRGSKGDQMLPSQVVSMVEDLWPTPDVCSGYRDMSKVDPQAQKRAETHRTVGLHTAAVDWTEGEWPSPVTSDGERGSKTYKRGNPTLKGAAQAMTEGEWPTPATRDWRSGEASPEMYVRNARPLNEMVIAWMEEMARLWSDEGIWATPSAAVVNDGEGHETWRARQAKLKLKGYNGNGAGVPLTIQSQEVCLFSPQVRALFAGVPLPTTDPTSSLPSPQTDGSQNPAPSTRSSSRGSTLVRLNPRFTIWLMGGIEMVDWLHSCQPSAAAPELNTSELLAMAS